MSHSRIFPEQPCSESPLRSPCIDLVEPQKEEPMNNANDDLLLQASDIPESPAVLLVDLSSIAHPIWHMSQAEPDPNHTSQRTAAAVRHLAANHPHAAICCDSPKVISQGVGRDVQSQPPGPRSSAPPSNRPREGGPSCRRLPGLGGQRLRGRRPDRHGDAQADSALMSATTTF